MRDGIAIRARKTTAAPTVARRIAKFVWSGLEDESRRVCDELAGAPVDRPKFELNDDRGVLDKLAGVSYKPSKRLF
jgi:hypothetical protein